MKSHMHVAQRYVSEIRRNLLNVESSKITWKKYNWTVGKSSLIKIIFKVDSLVEKHKSIFPSNIKENHIFWRNHPFQIKPLWALNYQRINSTCFNRLFSYLRKVGFSQLTIHRAPPAPFKNDNLGLLQIRILYLRKRREK